MDIKDIKIRNAYSEKNNLTFIYKDENGKRKKFILPNYLWYCVIKREDFLANKQLLKASNTITKVEADGDYVKLYANKDEGWKASHANNLIKILKMYEIEVFEGDLHSAKRYMVDHDVQVSDKYDILYFDIETDDTNRKIQIGATRILSFGAIDNEGNEFYFDDEDEKELLTKALKLMGKYDVIAGWNSDDFDLPYIFGKSEKDELGVRHYTKGRAELHGLPKFHWYKTASIDMLRRARKLWKEDASLKSYSLENVSQHFLGRGKSKFDGKIVNLPKDKLKEYNMNDVYLLKELDEKTGMIDLVAKECALSKTLIRDFAGVYVSTVLDSMILREAHSRGIYAPSKKRVVEEIDYVGGLVFDPQVGYHKNVYVFDFKSLYPSIIMTSNIGFDTVIPIYLGPEQTIINPGTKVSFKKEPESIIAKVVRQLVEERQSYKQLRLELVGAGKMKTPEYEQARANEIIVKELSNSVYGIMGNQGLRYYSLETAESITKTGHYLLRFTRDFFNNIKGLNVIYGDTDSVFVASKKKLDVEKVLKVYHQELQDNLRKNFNIETSYIQLKYEKLFESMILIGKKYYAGRVVNIEGKKVNEFVAKGIDYVKKATLPMALESQKTIIDMILDGKSPDQIKMYVSDQKAKMDGKFTFDEIKITTGINREISDYKMKNAPHVKLARSIIEQKGVLEINEIEYVVVDDSVEKDSIEGLAMRDTFTGKFDKIFYWNQRIFPAMSRILDPVFPDIKWSEIYEIKKPRKIKSKIATGQGALF